MDLSAYFLLFQYVLMGATLLVLVLIFLYAYYGKDEEKTSQ